MTKKIRDINFRAFAWIMSVLLLFGMLSGFPMRNAVAEEYDSVRYEAELADITGSYKTDSVFPEGTSGGAAVDFIAGATLTFDHINVPATGWYEFTVAYTRGYTTSVSFPLIVNGESTVMELGATGSWNIFTPISRKVQLNGGENTIVLGPIDAVNTIGIDYIEISTLTGRVETIYEAELFAFENAQVLYNIPSASNQSLLSMAGYDSRAVLECGNQFKGRIECVIGYSNSGATAQGTVRMNGEEKQVRFLQTDDGKSGRVIREESVVFGPQGGTIELEILRTKADIDYVKLILKSEEVGYDFENLVGGVRNIYGNEAFDGQWRGDLIVQEGYTGNELYFLRGNVQADLGDFGVCESFTIDFDVNLVGNADGTVLELTYGEEDSIRLDIENGRMRYYNSRHYGNGMMSNASCFEIPFGKRVQVTVQFSKESADLFLDRALVMTWDVREPILYDIGHLSLGSGLGAEQPVKAIMDNFYMTNGKVSPQTIYKASKLLDLTPDVILEGDSTTVYVTQNSDVYVYPADSTVRDTEGLEQLAKEGKAVCTFARKGLSEIGTKGLAAGRYNVVAVNDRGWSESAELTIAETIEDRETALEGQRISVDMGDYMKRHELINTARPESGRNGVPLGNGVMLANVWNEKTDSVRSDATFQINRSDLFRPNAQMPSGDQPLNQFDMGNQPALAKISLQSGAPEESSFLQKLSLYDGYLTTEIGLSEGSGIAYAAYVNACRDVMVIDYQDYGRAEGTNRQIVANLWGAGVSGVITWQDRKAAFEWENGILYVSEKFTDGNTTTGYVLAISVEGAETEYSSGNKYGAISVRSDGGESRYKIYVSSVLTADTQAGKRYAAKLIEREKEDTASQENHKAWWNSVFDETFLSLGDHEEAEYLESLYYMNLYQMAASSRGKNPPSFNGRGWTTHEDEKNWGSYFWNFNIRSMYYSILPTGRFDLIRPYFKLYSEALTQMVDDTREVFTEGGILHQIYPDADAREDLTGIKVPETMNYDGRGVLQNTYVFLILTSGVDVSMIYWDYYLYTQDLVFLQTEAYPLMKGVAEFLMSYARENEEGYYDLFPVNSLEYNQYGEKSTNTLGAFRTILNILLKVGDEVGADAAQMEQWRHYLDKLQPFVTDDAGEIFISMEQNGQKITMENGAWQQPVSDLFYPYEMFSKYTEGYETARETFERRGLRLPYEWTPEPLQAIKLGLKDEVAEMLVEGTKKWQKYPNGMNIETARENTYLTEWLAMVGASVSTMLLSCQNDLITVFPAYPGNRGWDDAKFTLMASGGFMVTSEKSGGIVKYVAVESNAGSVLRIENPWGGGNEVVIEDSQGKEVYCGDAQIIELETKVGEGYIITRADFGMDQFGFAAIGKSEERTGIKQLVPDVIYGYDGRDLDL